MNDFLIERIGSREKLLFLISKFSGASLAYQSIFILYYKRLWTNVQFIRMAPGVGLYLCFNPSHISYSRSPFRPFVFSQQMFMNEYLIHKNGSGEAKSGIITITCSIFLPLLGAVHHLDLFTLSLQIFISTLTIWKNWLQRGSYHKRIHLLISSGSLWSYLNHWLIKEYILFPLNPYNSICIDTVYKT
jgi:hypothetical protein